MITLQKRKTGSLSIILVVILLLACAIIFAGCNSLHISNSKLISIVFCDNDYIEVKGSSYKTVEYCKDVEFTFRVQEGYKCKSNVGLLFYNNGEYILKINKITAPISVKIDTEKREIFGISVNEQEHLFSIAMQEYEYIEKDCIYGGEKVRIQAKLTDNRTFLCWSIDGKIEDGGTVLSHYADYAFVADSDFQIYANYVNFEGENKYIQYQLNGGGIFDSNTTSYIIEAKSQCHLRYNTDIGSNVIRDGYTLVGWNTASDGTGERIGLGSRVTVSEKITTLYAMWEKWTDPSLFEYKNDNDQITITKCNSQQSQVVIPSAINKLKVTKVELGAFSDLRNMQTVVLPNTITEVCDGAFYNCLSLTNLVFSDNISYISDKAFINTSPKYLYVNAVRKPSNVEIFGYKILDCVDRVLLSDKPNLIVQGGSSSAYGFNSEYFEELLDGEYNVTNFGWNAYRPMAFLMGITTHISKANDVYVHVGEIDFPQQYATDTIFQSCLWGISEGNYDVISWVDISIMTSVFDTFTAYNKERDLLPIKTYDEKGYYDSRGDVSTIRSNTNDEVLPNKYLALDASVFSENGFAIINGYYSRMQDKGVRVYESFGTINKDVMFYDEEKCNELEEILRTNLVCPLISKISDYLFDHRYMDDGNIHHLSTEGATIRTEKMVADLKKQWQKESEN